MRHVAEVIEVRYDSHEKVIQGLLRGEVSFVPRIPASAVRAIRGRAEFFNQKYALPTTHVLQFNPHCRALTARTLRRALVYALDRRKILEEVFLHESAGKLGRPTSAPWATASYAYNRRHECEPHKFDSALAFSLARSAEKELGNKLPVLKLVSSAEPEVQAAVARLVEQWGVAGIEVKATSAPVAAATEVPTIGTFCTARNPLPNLSWNCGSFSRSPPPPRPARWGIFPPGSGRNCWISTAPETGSRRRSFCTACTSNSGPRSI